MERRPSSITHDEEYFQTKVVPLGWRKGSGFKVGKQQGSFSLEQAFFSSYLVISKAFFRLHKNHFHRFSTNLFIWLRMWHHMLPISKSQLAVKYGNMPLTTPQRNQPSHTKRPIMCQIRLFKPWNYSVLKYITLVFNVTLERHSL